MASKKPDAVTSAKVATGHVKVAGSSNKQTRSVGFKGSNKENGSLANGRLQEPGMVSLADDESVRQKTVPRSHQDNLKMKEKVKKRLSHPKTPSSAKKRAKTSPVAGVNVEQPVEAVAAVDFDFHQTILPILKSCGFTSSSATTHWYAHPDIQDKFRNAKDLRCYLCKHGIPNVDSLSEEYKLVVEHWVKFANSPFPDANSLESIPPNEQIKKILSALGFEFVVRGSKTMIFSPGVSTMFSHGSVVLQKGVHYFDNLEDARVYVRANEILPIQEPAVRRTRSHRNNSASQEEPIIRLWAANSLQPLPVFQKRPPIKQEEEEEQDNNNTEESESTKKPAARVQQQTTRIAGENAGQLDHQAPTGEKGSEEPVQTTTAPVQGKLEDGVNDAEPVVSLEQGGDAAEKLKQYQNIRKYILVQRVWRDDMLKAHKMPLKKDAEIPLTPAGEGDDIDTDIFKLKRKLDHVQKEIEFFLEWKAN
ncbi:expressed unknown protein [Seminavis robusta]|uniref:Uncharacterized protein n=1 Tax=Seminavis robusta TaxID=568900 RepID=A0A9N8EEK5_9STRA|nr:expressed unknown protein [Seminavis robusta]|eukprot:Sro821_g207440.1 n/a (477) ;mRNA; r:40692-42122